MTNAIRANELALFTENENALNTIYNTACGEQVTLNEMIGFLQEISGKNIEAIYGPERAGDVRHSKADISKISSKLGYRPQVKMREGLAQVYEWYKENKTFE